MHHISPQSSPRPGIRPTPWILPHKVDQQKQGCQFTPVRVSESSLPMARLRETGCAHCHSPLLRQHWVFPTHHLFLPFSVGKTLPCTAWQPATGTGELAALSAQLLEEKAKPCPRRVFWERMGQLWGGEVH